MKMYMIALLLFLPLHLFAGTMHIKRCNVDNNSNATIIATIEVSKEDLLENNLSVYIDNEIYTLPLLYTENRGDNDFGVIFQNDSIMLAVSVYQNQLSGMLQKNGFHYSIERDSIGNLYLSEIDMCSIADSNKPLEPPQYGKSQDIQIYNTQDTIVRIAVFYTSDINNSFRKNIVSHVKQAVLYSNASFVNSDIGAQLELVYLGETSYTSINFDDDLSNFTSKNEGYMDEIHYIREKYGADVCVLLTASSGFCGLGWPCADYDYAFCAVQASTSCFNQYSFVHEIGHIVGCNHDAYVKPTASPSYSHGYIYLNGQDSWRTIMAYDNLCRDNGCSCPKILHWSNPNITYNGIATGDEISNNARIWNERVNTVSNFFHFPSVLFLKDTLLNSADYAYARVIDSISTIGECVVGSGSEVKIQVTEKVVLNPGFRAELGSKFHVVVEAPTTNIASVPQCVAPKISSENTDSTNGNITNNGVEIAESRQVISTYVYSINGQLLQAIAGESKDVSHLPSGIYILHYHMSDGSVKSEKKVNSKSF